MYSCCLTLRRFLTHVYKNTKVCRTHTTRISLCFSHFITLRLEKSCKSASTHTCTERTCTRDVTLTKVTRHLSNSCLRSAPCIVTVEAAYWSSQAEILRRRFHNSIWHKPTTKRINNITGFFFFFFSVKRAGHLRRFLKITPKLAQKRVSSFVNRSWEGVWASSLASSKEEASFDCHHLLSSLPCLLVLPPVKCSYC